MSKTLLFIIQIITPLLLVAQTADNFSDGDLTQNPPWTGTTDKFIVDNQVLRLNDNVAGTSFLATPNTFLDNAQWDIWVRIAFSPSNNNHPLIYLVSDSPDLTGPLNGYFLRIGKDGTANKRIYFFRQSGTIATEILAGTDNIATATNNIIRIRVRRDQAGNWSFFADPTGGYAFAPQGSISDMTHNSTQWFGMVCRYTSSNANRFYFDDIYVGPIIVDTIPPAITNLVVTSANTLKVNFSEPLNSASALSPANYFVDNGIGNPDNVAFLPGSNTNVALTFGSPFVSGQTNTLNVQNIGDLAGNSLSLSTNQFHWYVPKRLDLVFNEIMADPTPQVGLPAHEYIEIYNNSLFDINLEGWVLQHGTTMRTITSGSIQAGGFAVLTTSAALPEFVNIPNAIAITGLLSTALLNDGTTLTLFNSQNELIDRVSYSSLWYGDTSKNQGGWSLERIDPLNICGESDNWRAAIKPLGGTPGVINSVFANNPDTTPPLLQRLRILNPLELSLTFNEIMDENTLVNPSFYNINQGIGHPISVSVCPNDPKTVTLILPLLLPDDLIYNLELSSQIADCAGNAIQVRNSVFTTYKAKRFDIVFNEIMADATPAVGLPAYRYIEFYNTTNFPINLEGWRLVHGSTQRELPPMMVAPKGYAVITTQGAFPFFRDYASVFAVPGLSESFLTNSGQTLSLILPDGELISWVAYNDTWYGDPSKSEGGWSLEKIDPYNHCAGSSNWRASIDRRGGTPGGSNSIQGNNPDRTIPALLRAGWESSNRVSLFFDESIAESQLSNPANFSLDNDIGHPLSVIVHAPHFMRADLILPTDLQPGVIYTVRVAQDLADCAGNQISQNSARVALPQEPDSMDIVINEILFNPPDRGQRYIEIYNRSTKVIDLRHMILSSKDSIGNILTSICELSAESHLIFPEDYKVITTEPDVVKSQFLTSNPGGFIPMMMPSMNNTNGIIVLATKGRQIIDQFAYNENMHHPLLSTNKGVALERLNYHRPTQDRSNWHSAAQSVGFGTPGFKNSQFTLNIGHGGDEIQIYPKIFSPDNDGRDDLLNISYIFDTPGYTANINIYDSKGRLVRVLRRAELLSVQGVITWDGVTNDNLKAPVGIYMIFIEAYSPSGNVKTFHKTAVLGARL